LRKSAQFSKLLWKLLRKNLGKYVGKHSPSLTWRKLRNEICKKYAMLTLSLNVICDVICYLRDAAMKVNNKYIKQIDIWPT